ncbi:MAG TPA: hypothetical protein VFW23_03835 [Tepidisphaeraceae bacterium]|nr:hypothetical protein [Tepidisphaeraceae bacterium]
MIKAALTIASIPSLALCMITSCMWLESMANNNYWDSPAIMHLGGFPAVYVAVLSFILPAVTAWLWYWDYKRSKRRRGFPMCHSV